VQLPVGWLLMLALHTEALHMEAMLAEQSLTQELAMERMEEFMMQGLGMSGE